MGVPRKGKISDARGISDSVSMSSLREVSARIASSQLKKERAKRKKRGRTDKPLFKHYSVADRRSKKCAKLVEKERKRRGISENGCVSRLIFPRDNSRGGNKLLKKRRGGEKIIVSDTHEYTQYEQIKIKL